jgi:hypothetical protein
MKGTLEQQALDIYSSDPLGAKEQPPSPNYEDGVDVGYTAPAKWWNWLYNKLCVFFSGCLTDRTNMLAELLNVLSATSVTPDSTDTHQLSNSISSIGASRCSVYNSKTVTETVGGTQVTYKVNQPDVVGYTLRLPDTELL